MIHINRVARRQKPQVAGMRWMNSIDGGKALVRDRHLLTYVNDCSVMILNSTPFGHGVDASLYDLEELHDICPNSLLVGSLLLRDDSFFISSVCVLTCWSLTGSSMVHPSSWTRALSRQTLAWADPRTSALQNWHYVYIKNLLVVVGVQTWARRFESQTKAISYYNRGVS